MKFFCTVALCAVALNAATPPDSKSIFNSIFTNDSAALRKLVTGREAANARGERETTALMYACAFGSVDAVRLLLRKGADVNASNAIGATALMWSTSEPAKVKLLLEHGAGVNAQTAGGRTALVVAAMQPGSDQTVNMLLAKGADVHVTDHDGLTFIEAAAGAGNSRQVGIALDRGVKPDLRDGLQQTPLMAAAGMGDLKSVKLLLAKGADPNAVSAKTGNKVLHGEIELGSFTPLLLAATYGPAPVVAELLKAGAKVDARDRRGMTPLMLAMATEHRDPETIRLLREAGSDLSWKAANGETVSDWEAKFIRAEEAKALVEPAIEARASAERGLALLRKTSQGFLANGGCVACHAQVATGMTMRTVKEHGLKITDADLSAEIPMARNRWPGIKEELMLRYDPPGDIDTLDYALFYLSAVGHKPDAVTSAMLVSLMEQQLPDGSWHGGAIARAPMEDSDLIRVAMSMRALQQFAWEGRRAEINARIEKAHQWLLHARPVYNEEFAMQVLGLKWAGDPAAATLAAKLAAMQNADGGWNQNPKLASDAYATGQTLYALHEAGMKVSDPAFQRGVRFLRATQSEDGSWHVKSRAPKFQPYFESGFPYGHDQWISMTGTAWATIACAMQ